MMRQQWLMFVPVTLATAGLAACASVLGGEQVKVRPIDNMATLTSAPRDVLYESAVTAINERDYGRALEYLQAAKAKDPRNVKALNALGVVYDKLGRFDLSARYYAQARAIEPDSKIVAENMGYSSILQRILNPNQAVAVANIDLPADLGHPAAAVTPSAPPAAEKTTVATAVTPLAERKLIDAPPPAVTAAPLVLPDTKPLFASAILPEPVMPVVERRLIDTPPATLTAMPLALPDAKHVFASVSLPEPVMPVTERRLIDTPPSTLTAMPLALPDAKHVFASVILPEPVMPVTERKLIDAPRAVMAAPVALPDASHVFASVILPEPVVPVTEKKVIDAPRAVMAAPFLLPDTKPLFAASLSPAVLSLPVPVAEKTAPGEPNVASMATALSPARATMPISGSATSLAVPAVERMAMVQSAPSAITVPMPPRPVTVSISGSPVWPQAEAKAMTVSLPAVPAIAATAPARPVVVASSVAPMASAPQKKIAARPVPAVTAAPSPPKPAMSVQVAKRVAEKPVTVASAPALTPARLRMAVPLPSAQKSAGAAAKSTAAKGGVLTIGQPIKLLNASGKPGGTGTVLHRLTTLGWTMRPADSRAQPATMLFYPAQNLAAAKAMQRTLPFPVRLIADSNKTAGMRLVIGRDYLSWKPKNSRIAVLWQKRTLIASAQKLSLRGDR